MLIHEQVFAAIENRILRTFSHFLIYIIILQSTWRKNTVINFNMYRYNTKLFPYLFSYNPLCRQSYLKQNIIEIRLLIIFKVTKEQTVNNLLY